MAVLDKEFKEACLAAGMRPSMYARYKALSFTTKGGPAYRLYDWDFRTAGTPRPVVYGCENRDEFVAAAVAIVLLRGVKSE